MIGKGYKTRLLNPHDELWDRKLGVHTFGFRPGSGSQGEPDWQVHYVPSSYRDIVFLMKYIGLTSSDTFIDLGCGMGRVVFAASWMGAKRCIGVEILPDLCEIAEKNRRNSRLADRDISFLCKNAKEVDISGATVVFMYHSFGEDTLRTVLQNAGRYRDTSKPIRIIYVNPVFNAVLKDVAWLTQLAIVRRPRQFLAKGPRHDCAIWEAVE